MKKFICKTCGVQYGESEVPPEVCKICSDERQYIGITGQSWTTLDEMKQNGFENRFRNEEEGVYSITTEPEFGIGQTAYIVKQDEFNLMWDCITYVDEATVEKIQAIGGLSAIALSHPHYYSSQAEWAERFDVPIYIHEDDREWITRPSDRIVFWQGEQLELYKGIKIHRLGGHFKGGCVAEWKQGNSGKGILFSGDIIQVVADRRWVSFMYSYPNLIPLPATKVREMAKRVESMEFDKLYNAFYRVIEQDAKAFVRKSAERYIAALEGTWPKE